MAIATPEVYAEMIDRAKAGKFAYPAVNITSSQTVTAALQGFAEAESDGIIQVSVGGAEYASGSTVKDRVTGSLALAAYAAEVAKGYGITVAIHTDHCVKKNLDSWVRPLLLLEAEQVKAGKNPTFQSHMFDGSSSRRRPARSSRSRSASSVARRTATRPRSTTSCTRPSRTAWPRSRRSVRARRAAT
jgi:fructose-bisphosphate aldolase class II